MEEVEEELEAVVDGWEEREVVEDEVEAVDDGRLVVLWLLDGDEEAVEEEDLASTRRGAKEVDMPSAGIDAATATQPRWAAH